MAILGVFGVLLVMLVPTAIVVLIITAGVNKQKGNDVSKFTHGVKATYTYIIIIATLFMIISGTIVAVSSLLDYFLPESELELSDYDCEEYYEDYADIYCSDTNKQVRIQNEKNAGITDFAGSLALVIIATPLFISHSKAAKAQRENKTNVK